MWMFNIHFIVHQLTLKTESDHDANFLVAYDTGGFSSSSKFYFQQNTSIKQ